MKDCELWQGLTHEAKQFLREHGVSTDEVCSVCHNALCVNVESTVYDTHTDETWGDKTTLSEYPLKDGGIVREVLQAGADMLYYLRLQREDGTVFCEWPEEEIEL